MSLARMCKHKQRIAWGREVGVQKPTLCMLAASHQVLAKSFFSFTAGLHPVVGNNLHAIFYRAASMKRFIDYATKLAILRVDVMIVPHNSRANWSLHRKPPAYVILKKGFPVLGPDLGQSIGREVLICEWKASFAPSLSVLQHIECRHVTVTGGILMGRVVTRWSIDDCLHFTRPSQERQRQLCQRRQPPRDVPLKSGAIVRNPRIH
mmetsp:Transcript_125681/g.250810  ORF Transcript_125681/g.250810 Transcript_125681/m.250810 type:complete len:207 (-) Transcript_125681:96-716(-)